MSLRQQPTPEARRRWNETQRAAAIRYAQSRKTTKPIRRRSKKMAVAVRLLSKEYAAFLAEPEHEWCEFPLGCGQRSDTVHHLAGRVGSLLRDRRFWRGSCTAHNGWCEDNPAEANRIGWRLPRVGSPVQTGGGE